MNRSQLALALVFSCIASLRCGDGDSTTFEPGDGDGGGGDSGFEAPDGGPVTDAAPPDGSVEDSGVEDGAIPDGSTDGGSDASPSVNDGGVDASDSGALVDDGGDAGADAGIAAACPELPPAGSDAGMGTLHEGTITADETWTAAGSPHVVTFDMAITEGATVTIEPCAVVRIREGYVITIGGNEGQSTGALVAHGESIANPGAPPTRRPVIIERDDHDAPWGSILTYATGHIDFEVVDLKGGGNPATANLGGTLGAQGAAGNTGMTKNLRAVDVTIEGSGGVGINLQDRAGFTDDSGEISIKNAGSLPPPGNVDTSYAMYVQGAAVSTIPEGDYTGNAKDAIAVGNANLLIDPAITFHERGVPYEMLNGLSMGPEQSAQTGGLSTLTIEAGVVMKFFTDGAMTLGVSNGGLPENIWPTKLVAEGTEAAPIVLTSVEDAPAPGSWVGLRWAGGPTGGNVMSHVTIDYAGADSGSVGFGCGGSNDGALIFLNWRPGDAFITSSTFSNSLASGIVCGWNSDDDGPDFTGNTFTNVGNGCNVGRWADGDGSCPTPPPICF